MTARPHDALFKSAFEAPADATALLCELLPSALREMISWDTLERETGSFVDTALADRHSDLLFSARLKTGDPALLYLLLEHQSTSDPAMPLRMLSYQIRIWDRFRKEQPAAWLPPVIAVLVSHVPGGWTSPRSLEDLFDPSMMAIPGLAALIPRFSMLIEDLARLSNDELKGRSLAEFQKLALWLLRDARDPARLLESFGVWSVAMAQAARSPAGIGSFSTLLAYMFRVVDPVYLDQLRARLVQLGNEAEAATMTIADQFHEEGRIAALCRQLTLKFKALDASYEARVRGATPKQIDRYIERVLTADSLAAVFED